MDALLFPRWHYTVTRRLAFAQTVSQIEPGRLEKFPGYATMLKILWFAILPNNSNEIINQSSRIAYCVLRKE